MKLLCRCPSIILLLLMLGCSAEKEIGFQMVNQTEIPCDLIFADTRKTIMELNEIMIQVGPVFGGKATMMAVIHIDGEKQELMLSKSETSGNHTDQIFANNGYRLELEYNKKKQPAENINANEPYFEGKCQLWHGSKHSTINIYGLNQVPDMFN